MKEELLRLERVMLSKSNINYLTNLSMWIEKSEILGFISLDYHGLDELIDLIINNSPIQQGRVYFDGETVNSYLGRERKENKVYMVNSQSRLAPDLTVADNIFVLRKGFKKYVINSHTLEKQVSLTLAEHGINIQPQILARTLTEAERYQVELVKAILFGAKLVIIQNVGELLSHNELLEFHRLIKSFAQQGTSFLYISNDFREVFAVSHRTLLYKSGQIKKVLYKEEMISEEVAPYLQTMKDLRMHNREDKELVFEAKDMRIGRANTYSFCIHQGECVTLLDKGNVIVQQSIMDFITQGMEAGSVYFSGEEFAKECLLIPDNPIKNTLFPNQSYLYNLLFLIDKKINKSIIPSKVIESIKQELGDKIGDIIDSQSIEQLSFKEKYQLIYYKALLYRPKLVIVIQPFAVADVSLREEIIKMLAELKARNIAVLLLSSVLSDTKLVSDQLIVFEDE
ncbi:ribose transport system ATP-binding protein [Lachnospiraceae bacterium PM6-15]|uniref:ATP-binding cassette domain-containing protein n=1 Tax=Ohessyouella blattaphilus TaxID=2949333 RepID=UPI003E23FEEF